MRSVIRALCAASGCVALAFACSSSSSSKNTEDPCMPGEAIACRAESGCDGERRCRANGLGFEPCTCLPGSGGASGAPGNGGSGETDGSGGSAGANGGEAGAGGETPSDGGAGGESVGGRAGADSGDAGSDAFVCEANAAGCPCIDERCGPGLGCASSNVCIAMPAPVAHWPLDVNADDTSANAFDGLAINGVSFDGEAANFDGVDSYVDISPCAPKFRQISGLMTVYIRLRAIDYDSGPLLFGLGDVGEDPSGNGFWFMVNGGLAAIDTESGNGVDSITTLGAPLPVASWLDLAFVVDQNTVDHYLNGTLVTSTQFVPAATNASHMQIGGWITPENVLNGAIDDVQLFDVKLTPEQVDALPSTR